MPVPHPKRMLECGIYPHLDRQLGGFAASALHDMLADPTLTKGAAVRDLARVMPHTARALAEITEPTPPEASSGSKLDLASLEPVLTPLRFQCMQGRVFEVRPELDRLLAQTDIGAQAPVRFFRLPYASMFLIFGAGGDGLEAVNEHTGDIYELDGAYLVELQLGPEYPERALFPELRDDTPIRVYEITLVGKPKRNPLDCGFVFARLMAPDQWGDQPLETVLERQLSTYAREGTSTLQARGAAALRAGVLHIAKTLLYLNSEQARTSEVFEEHALRERLTRVKGGKRAKLERQLGRAYDRIVVGSLANNPIEAPAHATDSRVRSHWRRGHFRSQPCGEGSAQRKLIWIQPALIGADELAGPAKDFSIR